MNKIIQGDCLEKLKELEDNSVDSIVTDPPAGISFMGKSWDSDKGGRDNWIKWMSEIATECKRVLKPGGHAFVWAIPRTSHWTATAWENAGFEIRDVVAHIFGSGFPKSLNIGKQVDKLHGNERDIIGETRIGKTSLGDSTGWDTSENMKAIKESGKVDITKGTSEWEGWGTALKPAREDWILMRKPLSEKSVAENCLKWGTGGINIDESRVEYQSEADKNGAKWGNQTGNINDYGKGIGAMGGKDVLASNVGRFPANLIHDNSEEVRECFPEQKSGTRSSKYEIGNDEGEMFNHGIYGKYKAKNFDDVPASSGNASRFFKSIIYQAKSSKSERNKGCEGLEEKERIDYGGFHSEKGLITNNRNPENRKPTTNNHPTVKPIALMEYLIKMITPKGGVVLDPFAGSGSTLVAAKQNGYQYIGIEMTEEYIPIIEARLNAVESNLFNVDN